MRTRIRSEGEYLQWAQTHPGWCSLISLLFLVAPTLMEQKKQLRLANGDVKDGFSSLGGEQIPAFPKECEAFLQFPKEEEQHCLTPHCLTPH